MFTNMRFIAKIKDIKCPANIHLTSESVSAVDEHVATRSDKDRPGMKPPSYQAGSP